MGHIGKVCRNTQRAAYWSAADLSARKVPSYSGAASAEQLLVMRCCCTLYQHFISPFRSGSGLLLYMVGHTGNCMN